RLPRGARRRGGRRGSLGPDPLLSRALPAGETLDLTASLHDLNPEPADVRIKTLLEEVGVERRAGDRVAELSAGMRQRIDICRAVLPNPELLLLDEPDAPLDAEARRAVGPLIAAGERTRAVGSHDRGYATPGAEGVTELRR